MEIQAEYKVATATTRTRPETPHCSKCHRSYDFVVVDIDSGAKGEVFTIGFRCVCGGKVYWNVDLPPFIKARLD